MAKRSSILHRILVSFILIVCNDAKPVLDSMPDLSDEVPDALSVQSLESKYEQNTSYTEIIPISTLVEDSVNSSKVTVMNVTFPNPTTLDVKSLLTEFPVTAMSTNFNGSMVSDRAPVSTDSTYSVTEDLSEDSSISLDNDTFNTQHITPGYPIAATVSLESNERFTSVTNSVSSDSNFSTFEDSPNASTIPSKNDTSIVPPVTSEIPVATGVFHSNESSAIIEPSSVTDSVSVDSSAITEPSSVTNSVSVNSSAIIEPSSVPHSISVESSEITEQSSVTDSVSVDSSAIIELSTVADSISVDSSTSDIENLSEVSTIPPEYNTFHEQPITHEFSVTSTASHFNVSSIMTDIVSLVSHTVPTDSSSVTTYHSSEGTTISSPVNDELEQQSFVTELPTESNFSQFDISTTVATTTTVSETVSSSHPSTEFSKETTSSSMTISFEVTASSHVPDIPDVDNTETLLPVESAVETNDTSDSDNSVCSVCQNCTDDYIDRMISDVTAGLPNSLELPNRQGRFQLYHGQLFGLNTLKRSEKALVACLDKHNYVVMVPLSIQNAKAFYKWQVEMPLRTFYGDLNVTVVNTECRVFYSHSKGTSLVEGLKITELQGIQTEFSGMGPFNGLMAGFTRTLISMFRRSFAKTIENTLVHVINKELQDVRKYEEYYAIKW